ncbi:LysM peptidoglycan-binding domain-containing protein [Nocardia bovistercoris]|uniref:LysM peptidoglycan-binding domain-containing protein n=1 Tax=Nocardia bovistercoris TaxID=2785916 RepID=A0A931ICC9_9NOCA|nr:LysM domain-containing protein [Nocardia bovistercoris]MBH0777946.1 LysM peptidoglycan-binding domain-containing protein [Nocardia bovistercoris]
MVEIHTVVAGDTLSEIVMKKYGDLKFLRKIAELNNIANPDLIRVGQKISLPSRSDLTAGSSA